MADTATRRIDVIAEDRALGRVGEIKMPPVGTEADAIGDGDTCQTNLSLPTLETVKLPLRLTLTFHHGASPESALPVHATIIEADIPGIMFGACNPLQLPGFV